MEGVIYVVMGIGFLWLVEFYGFLVIVGGMCKLMNGFDCYFVECWLGVLGWLVLMVKGVICEFFGVWNWFGMLFFVFFVVMYVEF